LRFLQLDTVTSTMDVARERLLAGEVRQDRAGRLNLRGVTAQEQTVGRGQRGRNWYAPHGESLCATYYFRHGITDPQSAGHVSLLAGVAAANTLCKVCRRYTTNTQIPNTQHPTPNTIPPRIGLKWPNDLLLNDKKVGGILVELVQTPMLGYVALIGVGINVQVRNFPPELAESATSLWLEGVRECPAMDLAEIMARELNQTATVFRREGLAAILRRWRNHDRTPGRRYRLEQNSIVIEGTATGIDDAGALILRADEGRLLTTLSASSLKEIPVLSR
jgi:BirA family transcriptional regulator, biotin operon repressor / biotin---[acetyl-CoA-carboxylase] ligase